MTEEFKFQDFSISLYLSENNPQYDNLEVGIDQGGYYGASCSASIYDSQLDYFLERIVEFKALRDKNKESK